MGFISSFIHHKQNETETSYDLGDRPPPVARTNLGRQSIQIPPGVTGHLSLSTDVRAVVWREAGIMIRCSGCRIKVGPLLRCIQLSNQGGPHFLIKSTLII